MLDMLTNYIKARFPIIYVVTPEEPRILKELEEIGNSLNKKLFSWSITTGMISLGAQEIDEDTMAITSCLNTYMESVDSSILIIKDPHQIFDEGPAIIRKFRDCFYAIAQSYKTVIIISPIKKIPLELEKEILLLDFPFPTTEDIDEILTKMVLSVQNAGLQIDLSNGTREKVANALLGLTVIEIQEILAMLLVTTKGLNAESVRLILREKEQVIKKSGTLEFYNSDYNTQDVGGLDLLKEWFVKRGSAFSKKAQEFGLPVPKGVLILGVQGAGKSLISKVVSNMWSIPMLRLDMGAMFAGIVGSSEQNMRNAIKMAEAVAPCILFVDEADKAFSGMGSSNQSDSGTTARVIGAFLTWLQDKTSPVFVVMTANDISNLPPELLRKGRLDEIFFVDLPTYEERMEIFKIHIEKRKRDSSKYILEKLGNETDGFSGGEIEQVVISALYDAFSENKDLTQAHMEKAIAETVPLSKTMKEQLNNLREWSKNRTRAASSTKAQKMNLPNIGIEFDKYLQ